MIKMNRNENAEAIYKTKGFLTIIDNVIAALQNGFPTLKTNTHSHFVKLPVM